MKKLNKLMAVFMVAAFVVSLTPVSVWADISWEEHFEHGGVWWWADSDKTEPNGEGFRIGASNTSIVAEFYQDSIWLDEHTTIDGNLTVNGNLDMDSGNISNVNTLDAAGLASLNGGIAVDTDNFTVSGTTGAVYTASTLDVDGASTLSGINNQSGNITNAGAVSGVTTLSASGLASLNGGIAVDTNNFTVSEITGAVHTASTLDVDGAATLDGGATVKNGAVIYSGNGTGNTIIVNGTTVSALTSDGLGLTASNGGNVTVLGANSKGLTIDGTTNQTILSGGTNTSSWTLGDNQATLGVGTASTPEITLINATNTDGAATSVIIGDAATGSLLTVDENGTRVGDDTNTGTLNVSTGAASNGISLTGANGTGAFGNGTDTAGTVNISSATSANTISLTGSNATGTFGNATNAGTVYVQNGMGANTVALNGTGDSVIANGVSLYSTGTAAAGTGSNVLVSGTSVQANSSDGFTNMTIDDGTATFKVQNTTSGAWHGVDVNQTRTVLSGGTDSTSLTLDDGGATFRNDSTGGPARVTGVADGSSDYDAVNYRQLKGFRDEAFAGIASVAALTSIPSPAPGKKYSIGGGWGNFQGHNAGAVGGKAILFDKVTVTAGVGIDDQSAVTTAVGVGWSF